MIEINKKTLKNLFFVAVGCIVLYWILHEGERVTSAFSVINSIFSPFVMGAAFAFVLNVPMRAFEKLFKNVKNEKLKRVFAVILTMVGFLLVIAIVFLLLIPQLADTIQSLIPKMQTFFVEFENYAREFLNQNPELLEWLKNNTDLENFDWAALAQNVLTTAGNSLSTILGSALSVISVVTGLVVDLVIAIVFALYCLFQKETLARQGRKLLYAFLPEKFSDNAIRILRLSNSTFSNFLSGQCVEVCILGSLFAISMAIFKMPYIPLVSVLVAVTAFIPIVGAFVGCFIGAFLIFVANPMQAVWFVIMFLVIQQIENNMIYPRVVGTSIGLSGMWVLLAVTIGGELMGIAGMFLMIPVSSVLYTLIREQTAKRLEKRNIDPEKLKVQPPELRSHFKEKHKKRKEKWALKKAIRKAKRTEEK